MCDGGGNLRRMNADDRHWSDDAVLRIESDLQRSSDTHLLTFPLPPAWGVDLYLKDESVHPTGSLKHRLARSLFLYALANGWLREGCPVVEASSGSTAVSEAYFARLLGLPFVAVVPAKTSVEKVALIEREGGTCHFVTSPAAMDAEARRLAAKMGGHFMDQFTYAERATDWRGNNNIAESMFEQLRLERYPVPEWVVVGAGTGGTSATIGRFVRYRRLRTRVCVADPEGSAFYPAFVTGDLAASAPGSRIEGIGRPRVEPSFVPTVVDEMISVPDSASLAAMRMTTRRTGRSVGGSTGTNVWAALQLVQEMVTKGRVGSVVTLICDGGERYSQTYYDDSWLAAQGLNLAPYDHQLRELLG